MMASMYVFFGRKKLVQQHLLQNFDVSILECEKSEYPTSCDECAPYWHYSHQIKQMGHLHTEDNWRLRGWGGNTQE